MVTKAELESQLSECRQRYAASVLDQSLAERQYKNALSERDASMKSLGCIRTAMEVRLATKHPMPILPYGEDPPPMSEEELLVRWVLTCCEAALKGGDHD